jgi:molybdopterin-guanine dinucleotide biosynthesis protein A
MAEGLAGVVVAGGRSSRFGSDKAAALFRGRPMLAWVLDALAPCCDELIVVRADGQGLPHLGDGYSVTLVHDEHFAQGPLAGLIAGLDAVTTDRAFASSTDVPLLQPRLIRFLSERAQGFDVVVPDVGGSLQPFSAVYRTGRCLEAFRKSFDTGNRRVVAAYAGLEMLTVDEATLREVDPDLLSFRNANTPAELADLERLTGGS